MPDQPSREEWRRQMAAERSAAVYLDIDLVGGPLDGETYRDHVGGGPGDWIFLQTHGLCMVRYVFAEPASPGRNARYVHA